MIIFLIKKSLTAQKANFSVAQTEKSSKTELPFLIFNIQQSIMSPIRNVPRWDQFSAFK